MITNPMGHAMCMSSDQCKTKNQEKSENIQNIKEVNFDVVREFYKDVVFDIPLEQVCSNTDEITLLKAVRNIMTIRNREFTPKRPPRIIFLSYPSNFLFIYLFI